MQRIYHQGNPNYINIPVSPQNRTMPVIYNNNYPQQNINPQQHVKTLITPQQN
jgi:hypothetical protein